MTNGIAQIPGFIAGTWKLDPITPMSAL